MPSDSSHRNSGITVIAGTAAPASHRRLPARPRGDRNGSGPGPRDFVAATVESRAARTDPDALVDDVLPTRSRSSSASSPARRPAPGMFAVRSPASSARRRRLGQHDPLDHDHHVRQADPERARRDRTNSTGTSISSMASPRSRAAATARTARRPFARGAGTLAHAGRVSPPCCARRDGVPRPPGATAEPTPRSTAATRRRSRPPRRARSSPATRSSRRRVEASPRRLRTGREAARSSTWDRSEPLDERPRADVLRGPHVPVGVDQPLAVLGQEVARGSRKLLAVEQRSDVPQGAPIPGRHGRTRRSRKRRTMRCRRWRPRGVRPPPGESAFVPTALDPVTL